MNIQRDEDGLLPGSRGLLELHKYVRLPKYLWRDTVKNKTFCEFWHGDCGGAVLSEKLAREVVALIPYIKPCECTEMLKKKNCCGFEGEARANGWHSKNVFDEFLEGEGCIN